MRLTTPYHHTRYEEHGSEDKFSLRMPRRKSSLFKSPVLIQFQVIADRDACYAWCDSASTIFSSCPMREETCSWAGSLPGALPVVYHSEADERTQSASGRAKPYAGARRRDGRRR